ncbi:Hsp20/alpha crystallin family protein [bacterium]|nr:Hsp20/alpha crystallin family protein [bacterium]
MQLSVFDPGTSLSLREAVNRLMEDRFVRTERGGPAMPVDVIETNEAVVVKAFIPGSKKENLQVQYEKEILTIKAEIHLEALPDSARFLLKERTQGKVSRTFRLPFSINPEQASAEYQDGVLTLTLPKQESVKPRSIQVN